MAHRQRTQNHAGGGQHNQHNLANIIIDARLLNALAEFVEVEEESPKIVDIGVIIALGALLYIFLCDMPGTGTMFAVLSIVCLITLRQWYRRPQPQPIGKLQLARLAWLVIGVDNVTKLREFENIGGYVVDVPDDYPESGPLPLHRMLIQLSVELGSPQCLRYLLAQSPQLAESHLKNMTNLAIELHSFETFKVIIDHYTEKENMNLWASVGNDLRVRLCCRPNMWEFAKDIMYRGSPIDVNKLLGGYTLLYMMCAGGKYDVVRSMINHPDIKVNALCQTTIAADYLEPVVHLAARKKDVQLIKIMTKSRASVNYNAVNSRGQTALQCIAALPDMSATIRQLLKCDIDVSAVSCQPYEVTYGVCLSDAPVIRAIKNGQIDNVKVMLEGKQTVDLVLSKGGHGSWALACAVRRRSPVLVDLLLPYTKCDITSRINEVYNERTALHVALLGETRVEPYVRRLLNVPAIDVNVRLGDLSGATPLMIAFDLANTNVRSMLLAHTDIDINAMDGRGRSLLHRLTSENRVDNVRQYKLLCRNDLDATLRVADEADGATVLHLAVEAGNWEMIDLLRVAPRTFYSVDFNALHDGRTPLQLALSKDEHRCVEAMLRHPKVHMKNSG